MSKLIQSYVYYKDKVFFVSTINRQSSAIMSYGGEYAETIAFEWDNIHKTCTTIVGQDEDRAGSLATHLKVCDTLHSQGCLNGDEYDES